MGFYTQREVWIKCVKYNKTKTIVYPFWVWIKIRTLKSIKVMLFSVLVEVVGLSYYARMGIMGVSYIAKWIINKYNISEIMVCY